eukprot:CAMPEP_0206214188 /NCGR_PEP_ID=MMETSP0047_2-20121206/1532_1 /ASSEMBLY_ACC=CAM_ASM_000192 /TAXON_ID=195065 /ORGANISM="Chroomonas mesostigmatica_cf, Strain CCMP1168" /LENGTH=79 /DNA_ID=CAMNT_0053636407 /DNA_START=177 /DNA_END=416 /DNA_ORIENTATION=-
MTLGASAFLPLPPLLFALATISAGDSPSLVRRSGLDSACCTIALGASCAGPSEPAVALLGPDKNSAMKATIEIMTTRTM